MLENEARKETTFCLLQQWFFSTAMDPITQWSFRNDHGVSEHLKSCPYNVRTRHEEGIAPKEKVLYDKALKTMRQKFEMKRQLESFKAELGL